jgi:hypothetical protein
MDKLGTLSYNDDLENGSESTLDLNNFVLKPQSVCEIFLLLLLLLCCY